ncbi:MAG: alkaline phosphatase [Prevotellaceae bacterium]|jgi:alkaline phosphatase|nr:alkaline phosphatase [Prevotellaceae bacterium]
MKKIFFIIALGLCLASSLESCQPQQPYAVDAKQPKYVFFFIGDGMGLAQVAAAEAYLAAKDGVIGSTNLSFSNFPVVGLITTFSANNYVTCSAAAGTALSTGFKTNNGMLGMLPDSSHLTSLTYKIKDAGYKIGVATTVGVDHATPAAFYASVGHRSEYYNIALQLPGTNFDFFAGGGFIEPTDKDGGKPDVHRIVTEAGYTIVRRPDDVAGVKEKVILFQAEGKGADLPYAIDRTESDLTLPQITDAAIKFLDNAAGFFVMIEGGKIDWASHANDGATAVYETIDFAEAVQRAVEFYHRYPDETLIVVTADHETGGLALNLGSSPGGLQSIEQQHAQKQQVNAKTYMNAIDAQPVQHAATGLDWTSHDHTGISVPVYAIGAGSELFGGKYDNTDIPKRICKAMGVAF